MTKETENKLVESIGNIEKNIAKYMERTDNQEKEIENIKCDCKDVRKVYNKLFVCFGLAIVIVHGDKVLSLIGLL